MCNMCASKSQIAHQLEYLGRYTHKVAISNHRLLTIDESGVRFRYRDYRDDRQKEMTLGGAEFLRQFCQHILPKGFVRIRHYGLLPTAKRPELRELQQAFGLSVPKVLEKKNWKQICGCISITARTAAPAVGRF
ncbi:MAG: hypothetical protein D4R64_16865 [Porphyromonadaceae bacterium]|nr:MAG: hypothetical protein D4R64_16865 [Porphyromonadaceae bacterium]